MHGNFLPAEFVKLSENSDYISSTSRKRHRAENYNCNESQDHLAEEIREIKAEISKFRNLALKHRFSLLFISALKKLFNAQVVPPWWDVRYV